MPDHLPATTHHLMPSFLQTLGGVTERAFFDRFGLDAITWTTPLVTPLESGGPGWTLRSEPVPDRDYRSTRYYFDTSKGTLTTLLQDDGRSTWVRERLLKEKRDVEVLEAIVLEPRCDLQAVAQTADAFGERGIVRGAVPGFPVYGQPGCWQDAAVLFGIEPLILATFSDAGFVKALLTLVQQPKLAFLRSARGARLDLIELGGGDASSTVISPPIFDRFVAPFDAPLIAAAHESGLRVVYHTCGGMMPFLERIADMGPDAMETFTPRDMGGDTNLAEAKRRIGHRVCMIGGFDQFHDFVGCTPDQTRASVRRAFEAAGGNGGYILAPSDHFFEAEEELLAAFADEARRCGY